MLATALTLLSLVAATAKPPDLVTVHDVRSLSARDARGPKTVRLSGVVTFTTHPHNSFYLQDGTGGVRVEWKAMFDLKPGDAVEVIGFTTAGPFLTQVRAASVQPQNVPRAALPKPERFNLTTDESHYLDAQWVQVEAVVQDAWNPINDSQWLKMDLARGHGTVVAHLPCPIGGKVEQAKKLRGAVVRVRGVWERGPGGNNPSRLLVTDLSEVEVVTRPADEASVPLLGARELNLQPRSDSITPRLPVRVEGIVTLNQGGRHFYVQDKGAGIVAVRFREVTDLEPGMHISVHAFPRTAGTTDPPLVENAKLLPPLPLPSAADLPLPAPVDVTPTEAASGKFEGRVVRLTGEVRATDKYGIWQALSVANDKVPFVVLMLNKIDPVEPGSTIEVVGVVTKQQFPKLPAHVFALCARAQEVRVLAGPPDPPAPPPFFTGRRIAYLTVGFVGLFLLGGATVTALRVQVRRARELARLRGEEKKQLVGQLDRSARLEAVGRVAGGVAHDFNNILTVINGCAQMLDEGADGPARATNLANIRRAGRLATVLTRLLLTFSRRRQVAPYPLDVNALLTDADPILARLLGPGTALCVSPDPALPPALADTGLLLQILINLTVNAGEAMPDGGTFTLATAAPEPGWVRLTATDTGAGMSADVRARVFERGFTTKAAGTGTGLATVYDAVRELGGRIRFRSEVGRGTEFEIDLPAAPPGIASVTPPDDEPVPARLPIPTAPVDLDTPIQPIPPRPSGPVALVVEDDDTVRDWVSVVLGGIGITVLAVADSEAALRALGARIAPVNLLVTDVTLPGLSGRELAARVRARCPDVRVLFMSGYPLDDVFPTGGEGAEFLHKPFTPRELTDRVLRLLGQPVG